MDTNKRVFFAFKVESPWPKVLPAGRIIAAASRHLTLAFLGDVNYLNLKKILPDFPKPKRKMGWVGKFDKCLFLPKKKPNVVAWHIRWFYEQQEIENYHGLLCNWLNANQFHPRVHSGGFLPHVTVARRPFRYTDWRQAFHSLPVVIQDIHLYESLPGLKYEPLFTFQQEKPFLIMRKNQHFEIYAKGETLIELFYHCFIAIAFINPQILKKEPEKLFDKQQGALVEGLNELLQRHSRMQIHSLFGPEQQEPNLWIFSFQLIG